MTKIEPKKNETREEFVKRMPTLMLFRPREAIGAATHYILQKTWLLLDYEQMRLIRRNWQQVCK